MNARWDKLRKKKGVDCFNVYSARSNQLKLGPALAPAGLVSAPKFPTREPTTRNHPTIIFLQRAVQCTYPDARMPAGAPMAEHIESKSTEISA